MTNVQNSFSITDATLGPKLSSRQIKRSSYTTCNTHLAWSKQKSIGWNKLSLNVFAQLKEKRLLKMAKDPSGQRENQSFGQKTALHVIIKFYMYTYNLGYCCHFTTQIITSFMNTITLKSLFFCTFAKIISILKTVVILFSCRASTIWGKYQIHHVYWGEGVGWLWAG